LPASKVTVRWRRIGEDSLAVLLGSSADGADSGARSYESDPWKARCLRRRSGRRRGLSSVLSSAGRRRREVRMLLDRGRRYIAMLSWDAAMVVGDP
jgi:hypothetical protein